MEEQKQADLVIRAYEAMTAMTAPVSELAGVERGAFHDAGKRADEFLIGKLIPAQGAFDQLVTRAGLSQEVSNRLLEQGKPNYIQEVSSPSDSSASGSASLTDIAVAAFRYIELALSHPITGPYENSSAGQNRYKERLDFYLSLAEAGLGEPIKRQLNSQEADHFDGLVALARKERENEQPKPPENFSPLRGVSMK